jgi:D-inositol-3-phosphate glycosyltransferase
VTRIAVVGPGPPYRGGIAQFNARLIQMLEQRAQVLAIGWAEQFPRWLGTDWRDPSAWSAVPGTPERVLSWRSPATWTAAARRILDARPDRVIVHWAHPFAAPAYLALLRRLERVGCGPRQVVVHNALPHEHRWIGQAASRLVLRHADALFAHSRVDAAALRRWFPETPVTAGFHPVYDIFEAPPGAPRPAALEGLSRPILLHFGFLRPYKGIDVLIRALPQVLRRWPTATVLVAGAPFGRRGGVAGLERLARRLGVDAHVRIDAGYVPNERVAATFRAADLVVLPYRQATQSGVLQVAYAFDRPVVASRVGGLVESVEEGVSGRLAEPGDPDSLAAAILRALDAPISRDQVHRYRQRFGWDRYVDLLLGGSPGSVSEPLGLADARQ